jgi:hypothetical protein
MVLCAVSADHTHIKLLEAPHTASAGDRITFPGFTGEAASSAQMAKKKILEKLAPQVWILILLTSYFSLFIYLLIMILLFLVSNITFFCELCVPFNTCVVFFFSFNVKH